MSSISFEAGKCGAARTKPVEWKAIVVWTTTDYLLAIVRQEKKYMNQSALSCMQ
jgi:hypothetical protein